MFHVFSNKEQRVFELSPQDNRISKETLHDECSVEPCIIFSALEHFI